MKLAIATALVAATVLAMPALAAGDHIHPHATVDAAPASLTKGWVKKVDWPNGKVTISHSVIDYLGMPEMTMVFRAERPELLDNLHAGDEVRFRAARDEDGYTVTALQVMD